MKFLFADSPEILNKNIENSVVGNADIVLVKKSDEYYFWTHGKYVNIEPTLITNFVNSQIVDILKAKLTFDIDDSNHLIAQFDGQQVGSVLLPSGGGGAGVPCTSLHVESLTLNLIKDSSVQITPTIRPSNTTDVVSFYTSDESKATVSSDGTVTWVSGGTVDIEICCGVKTVTVTVTCDEKLNTVYAITGMSYPSVIPADATSFEVNYNESKTEEWTLSGEVESSEAKVASIEVEQNKSVSHKTIDGAIEWNGQSEEYSVEQKYWMLAPFGYELSCSNTNASIYLKEGHLINSANDNLRNDRRAICKLVDNTQETHLLTATYDGLYIPADTQQVRVTWEDEESKWYFAANVFQWNPTTSSFNAVSRVEDAGWNYCGGEWVFDVSSYKTGLWLFGNFAYTKTRDLIAENHCYGMTLASSDFNMELTRQSCWSRFRSIGNVKVIASTGVYDTSDEAVTRGIQGGAIYNGEYYQFYDKNGGYKVYDLNDAVAQPVHHVVNCDPESHFGSVDFSNITSYGGRTLTKPLVFATGHYNIKGNKKEVVSVIDLDNDVLVKRYVFENRKDDVIAAWDFVNSKCWIIGYEQVNGYATTNWYIDEYEIEDLADPTNTNKTRVDSYYIQNTADNTLQDCKYKDGYIYIATGWGGTKGQTVTVFKFDVSLKAVIGKCVSDIPTNNEAEGFALGTDYMVLTTNAYLYKVDYCFDAFRIGTKVQLPVALDPEDVGEEEEVEITDEYLSEHTTYSLPNITEFNGVDKYVDTGVLLFDRYKTFSILIDYQSDVNQDTAQLTPTFMSCFDDTHVGLTFDMPSWSGGYNNSTERTLFKYNDNNQMANASINNKDVMYARSKILLSVDTEAGKVNIWRKGVSSDLITRQLSVESNMTFTALANSFTLTLGCRNIRGAHDRWWKGVIYDCKVYDIALPKSAIDIDKDITVEDLEAFGCNSIRTALTTYPNLMETVNGRGGMLFVKTATTKVDGTAQSTLMGSIFKTGVIPNFTDTLEIKFKTLTISDSSAKTLFCTRTNGTAGNSFTTFIISSGIRADYDNPSTTGDTNRYTLTADTHYYYTRNNQGDTMNYSKIKAYKNTITDSYSTTVPLVVGASITGATDYTNSSGYCNCSNYLNNVVVYLFAVRNESGQYRNYFVPCEDGKMIDIVTGDVINCEERNASGVMFAIPEMVSEEEPITLASE